MSRDRGKSDSLRNGFALPLTLGVLLVLSLTTLGVMQSIDTFTDRIEYFKTDTESDWGLYSVEQQVVWDALIAQDKIQRSGRLAEIGNGPVVADERHSRWQTDSEPMRYLHDTQDDGERLAYNVKVQDKLGLLDINIVNKDYLNFVARTLEISSGQRRHMTNALRDEIERHKRVKQTDDELFRNSSVTGLNTAYDLCRVKSWKSSSQCSNPTNLLHFIHFGSGLLANTRLSPKHITDKIGIRHNLGDLDKMLDWERIQQREGFYDPLQTNKSGGNGFHIWIEVSRTRKTIFLDLDLDSASVRAPYAIHSKLEQGISLTPIEDFGRAPK